MKASKWGRVFDIGEINLDLPELRHRFLVRALHFKLTRRQQGLAVFDIYGEPARRALPDEAGQLTALPNADRIWRVFPVLTGMS